MADTQRKNMANLIRKGATLSDQVKSKRGLGGKEIVTYDVGLEAQKEPENSINCLNCVKREFCREICPEVEAMLPRPQGGKKNKENHYAPDVLESMANHRALKYKGLAGRKLPKLEEN